MQIICGEIETICTHRLIIKELLIVTNFPRIISQKTLSIRISLSDFGTVVGSFVLIIITIIIIIIKLHFIAAFYCYENLLLMLRIPFYHFLDI